jgi:hypothetical protein
MPIKHVLSVMVLENHPGNPKLWTIAHKTAQKRKNNRFLVIPLKHLVSVMGLVNHLGNPKQWARAHENGPKTQNRRVFGPLKHVLSVMGHVNPQNPQTVGNSSQKRP